MYSKDDIQKAVEEIKATGMETFLNQEPKSNRKRSRSCR
ncbi:CotG/ExsB N-terminal domain-containing protein, partial [Bacillus pseudomycoides]